MSSGVDYSSGHPGGAALQAAGIKFAARYASHTPSKDITRAEADDLAAHGVSTVVVWESTASRALGGRGAGMADAETALTVASGAGMPLSRPIYFAVDFDPTAEQMPAVLAYLDGAASLLGAARTGVYGGYATVKAAFDGKHASWAWQTAAWSSGRWDARAHIRQPATGQHINGVACDNDTAMTADFGQWTPGKTPEVNPVPDLTPQIAADTGALRADLGKITSLTEKDAAGKAAVHPASWYLAHIHYDAVLLNSKFDQLAKAAVAPALTDQQVAALGSQLAADPAFTARLGAAFADAFAAHIAK